MKKSLLSFSFIILFGILLLILLTKSCFEMKIHFHNYVPLKLSNQDILMLGKTNLWIILFGILIEWKKARKIALGSIKLNLLIIPAILLIIYSFIPISTWVNWLSVWFSVLGPWGITFFANYIHIFLSCTQIQVILAILAGILLVRSVETGDGDN